MQTTMNFSFTFSGAAANLNDKFTDADVDPLAEWLPPVRAGRRCQSPRHCRDKGHDRQVQPEVSNIVRRA